MKPQQKQEELRDALASILNALPDIDPHDDESWMVDRCLPKFQAFIQSQEAELVEMIEGMKCGERKTKDFGEWSAETYEEKMLVNWVLEKAIQIIKKREG